MLEVIVRFVDVRGDCSFCWYWGNYWPSTFFYKKCPWKTKMVLQNVNYKDTTYTYVIFFLTSYAELNCTYMIPVIGSVELLWYCCHIKSYVFKKNIYMISIYKINFRENRGGNQEWTIQRNWQHWVHKTQDEGKKTKTQHNMCWTPLYENKNK